MRSAEIFGISESFLLLGLGIVVQSWIPQLEGAKEGSGSEVRAWEMPRSWNGLGWVELEGP